MFSPVALAEVVANCLHQLGHIRLAMVTCDVRMEILPNPFNLVVVWTIGRQEVQFDPPRQVTSQGREHDVALMNAIIVEDQMQTARVRKLLVQLVQQVQEQITRFPLALHPDDHAGTDIEGACQIAFLILSRRENFFLLAPHHHTIVAKTPEDYGWQRPSWTRELLVETMVRLTGVRIHVTTMSRALALIKARRGR